MRPRIDDAQRRARLGRRHHLATEARTDDVVALAGDLVGLHSSDPATVFLAAGARLARPSVEVVERALYDDRAVVRTLGMRRTMFVLPVELVPVVQAAVTDALVPAERRRLVQMIEEHGIAADGAAWLRKVERATLAAIDERGEATGQELSRAVPGLREKLAFGEGTSWATTVGLSTRVLFLLACEQRVVRGRPKGSWTSSQYRWAPMSAWLSDPPPPLEAADARAELARRWLASFGPAPATDLKWWTGWTVARTREALAANDVVEVDLDDGVGVVLPDDVAPVDPPEPWVALLPGLDPTTMGWKQRDWYLGAHREALFDRNGNAGPTVWVDGRIVGGWTQRADGEVVYELLDDVGRTRARRVAAEAAELQARLGDVRVKPRFPTPLDQRLRA